MQIGGLWEKDRVGLGGLKLLVDILSNIVLLLLYPACANFVLISRGLFIVISHRFISFLPKTEKESTNICFMLYAIRIFILYL